jgi:hypothetical protein
MAEKERELQELQRALEEEKSTLEVWSPHAMSPVTLSPNARLQIAVKKGPLFFFMDPYHNVP